MSNGLELVARYISVQFEGSKKLSDVTLAVSRRRITGRTGPNGASAFTNWPIGFQPVGSGMVGLDSETINDIATHKPQRKGVARTFQSGRLFRDVPAHEAGQPEARVDEHGRCTKRLRCTAEVVGRNSTRAHLTFAGTAEHSDRTSANRREKK